MGSVLASSSLPSIFAGMSHCPPTSEGYRGDMDSTQHPSVRPLVTNFVQPLVRLLLMLASFACTCLLMVAHSYATSGFFYGFDLCPWHCDLDLGNIVRPLVRLLLMLASSARTCLLMVAHKCAMSSLFMDLTFDLGAVTFTLEILSGLVCGSNCWGT